MYFMGETKLPAGVMVGPDMRTWQERGRDQRSQFAELAASTFERQRLVENFNSVEEAEFDAFERRIADVQQATGVKLDNPYRLPLDIPATPDLSGRDIRDGQREEFSRKLYDLSMRFPDQTGVIRADIPVMRDAEDLARKAVARNEKAMANAKDLSGLNSFVGEMGGALPALFRDPVNLYTAFIGGGAGAGRTMAARIMSRVATEGAINAGAEAVVQVSAQEWQKQAGVEPTGFWKNVGLAAAFGGGLGGLMQGAGEVLAKTGRATPETDAALQRMAGGEVAGADLRTMADAMGVKLDDADMDAFTRAVESDADTAAVMVPDLKPDEVDAMARAMTEGTRPPGLRDEVELFRGVKAGAEDNGYFWAPDRKVAETYAGDGGLVKSQTREFKNLLTVANWVEAKKKLGLPMETDMPGLIAAARAAGHDGMLWTKTAWGQEYVVLDGAPMRLQEDPAFASYVDQQNAAKIQRLEDWVAMNEADIAHLVDDGPLDALPSERDFTTMRAASDEDRAARVLQELRGKVEAGRREIAQGAKFSVDDVALQKRFADERGPRQVLPAPVREAKLGEVNSVAAQQQAAESFKAVGGMKPTARAKPDDFVKRETLDIMDALPAGTDVNGNPIVTTHAEMSDWAARFDDLADVIAACRAT